MESIGAAPPFVEHGTASAADVRLLGVRKTYGDVVAVDGVDLEIREGEFFTMLGPVGLGQDDLPAHDRRASSGPTAGGSSSAART